VFEGVVEDAELPLHYRLEVDYGSADTFTIEDPYAFAPTIGELDQHLIAEGRHEELYDKLGAHVIEHLGVEGTAFAVWAPSARAVSVVGDFNAWDGRLHAMRSLGSSGVWELFLPGLEPGERYKYEILGADGELALKADPYAQEAEHPPQTASIVFRSKYRWGAGDAEWLASRQEQQPLERPISIYEVHLGSWRLNTLEGNRRLSYTELADELSAYVKDMGFTHVELLPVMHHPFAGSWGYQVTGYFAPTPRHGGPDELRQFIERMHCNGVGVILDWVPAHFPRDEFGLVRFDGTALYEHADPRRGEHPDWGTLVFNFGRHEVRNFLISNALFWLREYHVDGIRVDAVASMLYLDYSRREGEWVPNQFGGREDLDAVAFLKELNEVMYAREPGIVSAAEESTAWPGVSRPTYLGGLGFGFKWNMGWMHDTLAYFQQDPIYRRYHHHELTFSLMYAFSENFILPLSHDEVVHGKGSLYEKMPGDRWQKLANLRVLYAYMWAHPGKKLLFMGGEFAQEREWSHERSLDWHLLEQPDHAGIQSLVRDLNRLYRDEPALWQVDSGGSSPTTPTPTWSRSRDSRATGNGWRCSSPTCLPYLESPTGWGSRGRAAGGRRSTPIRRITAEPTWATSGASSPSRSRGTGSRYRPRSPCRRWRRSGWCQTPSDHAPVGATVGGAAARRRARLVPRVGPPGEIRDAPASRGRRRAFPRRRWGL
jgi:1,4-alpha-glucan branching enzyme